MIGVYIRPYMYFEFNLVFIDLGQVWFVLEFQIEIDWTANS